MSPANSVKLLTWLLSTAENPCAVPTCSVGEVLAATMQPLVKVPPNDSAPGSKNPPTFLLVAPSVQASSPVLQACILLPLALPMSDIKASGTPARLPSLTLAIGPKLKKHDHSPNSTFNDQHDKRAHARTGEAHEHIYINSGCSLLPVQPESDNRVQPKLGTAKQCWWPATALTNLCLSSSIPLPVQLRVMLILTMGW